VEWLALSAVYVSLSLSVCLSVLYKKNGSSYQRQNRQRYSPRQAIAHGCLHFDKTAHFSSYLELLLYDFICQQFLHE